MSLHDTRDLLWIAASCYAFAVLFGFASTHFTKSSLCKQGTLFTIILGFLFHTRGLYLRGLEISGCPLGNNLERVQFITWSLILTFLILRILWKLNLLGSLCSGMAAIFGIISLLNDGWDNAYWVDQSYTRLFSDPWIELHASIAIFSYGIFALLAIVSVMYLIQRKALLSRKTGLWGSFLPPIHDLDHSAFRLLLIGTLFLTLSIIVGGMHWLRHPEFVTSLKLFLTLLLWAGYSILFFLRYKNLLFGSKFSQVAIALFLIAMVSMGFVNSKGKKLAEPETISSSQE
mgnify:CR=1 FL=1